LTIKSITRSSPGGTAVFCAAPNGAPPIPRLFFLPYLRSCRSFLSFLRIKASCCLRLDYSRLRLVFGYQLSVACPVKFDLRRIFHQGRFVLSFRLSVLFSSLFLCETLRFSVCLCGIIIAQSCSENHRATQSNNNSLNTFQVCLVSRIVPFFKSPLGDLGVRQPEVSVHPTSVHPPNLCRHFMCGTGSIGRL
jgi:hypothetical protein